jgi:hypothetical protein
VDVRPSHPSNTTRIVVTATLAGAAVAGVALGAVFWSNAQQDSDRAASLRTGPPSSSACVNGVSTACTALGSAVDSEVSNKNLATGFWIAGGVSAGAALASWFLLAPKEAQTNAALVTPQVSPRSAGCTITGRF